MDPVSLGLVASAAVKVLGPYLTEMAGKASEALIEKASDAAAGGALKGAAKLLELIRTKFEGVDKAEKSLERLEAAPEDVGARAELEKQLRAQLAGDPDFASALSSSLALIANTHADVAFVNNIQGDVGKIANFGTVYGDVTF